LKIKGKKEKDRKRKKEKKEKKGISEKIWSCCTINRLYSQNCLYTLHFLAGA